MASKILSSVMAPDKLPPGMGVPVGAPVPGPGAWKNICLSIARSAALTKPSPFRSASASVVKVGQVRRVDESVVVEIRIAAVADAVVVGVPLIGIGHEVAVVYRIHHPVTIAVGY